jgi:hypothetical protein
VLWDCMTCLLNDVSYSMIERLADVRERVAKEMRVNTAVIISKIAGVRTKEMLEMLAA